MVGGQSGDRGEVTMGVNRSGMDRGGVDRGERDRGGVDSGGWTEQGRQRYGGHGARERQGGRGCYGGESGDSLVHLDQGPGMDQRVRVDQERAGEQQG